MKEDQDLWQFASRFDSVDWATFFCLSSARLFFFLVFVGFRLVPVFPFRWLTFRMAIVKHGAAFNCACYSAGLGMRERKLHTHVGGGSGCVYMSAEYFRVQVRTYGVHLPAGTTVSFTH